MSGDLFCHVCSTAGTIFQGDIDHVVLRDLDGDLAIYRHHQPMLAQVPPSMVDVYPLSGEKALHIYVSGGYVEVLNNQVILFADEIMRGEEIDKQRAQKSKQEVNHSLGKLEPSQEIEQADYQLEFLRTMAQLASYRKRPGERS